MSNMVHRCGWGRIQQRVDLPNRSIRRISVDDKGWGKSSRRMGRVSGKGWRYSGRGRGVRALVSRLVGIASRVIGKGMRYGGQCRRWWSALAPSANRRVN